MSSVTISGAVTFDFVPVNTTTNGLNYAAATPRFARGVVVEAVGATGTTIASTVTSTTGTYSVTVPANTDVQIRARAQLLRTTAGTWNFTVRDNTSGNADYVLAGASVNSGTANSIRDLFAPSGWGGTSYTGPRTAAPFAILDALFEALTAFSAAAPGTSFPTGQVFWSTSNRSATGSVANGEISTTSYTRIGGVPTILVLGEADVDIDEYDRHVMVHEFGHYIEDQLARSDSVGGPHSLGNRLDPRVAMSEGWGNALSAIVLIDTFYRDSSGAQQARGFSFNLENNFFTISGVSVAGWFGEASVHSLIFDAADTPADNADTLAGGLAAVFGALRSPIYVNTVGPVTIYAFTEALRAQAGISAGGVDALLNQQNIFGRGVFGVGETNDSTLSTALPVIRQVVVGAPPIEICSVDDFGTINRVGNRTLMRFNVPSTRSLTFTMTRTSGAPNRDPDFFVFNQRNRVITADSAPAESETITRTLNAGDYWIDAHDFNNAARDQTPGDACYNFSIQ